MNVNSPSILLAIQKLRFLLTREEKLKWIYMMGFSLSNSFLELITASVIVVFAQVLNQPEVGRKYLEFIGFSDNLSCSRVVFYTALIVGGIYLVKNIMTALEVFYQNFTIQKMNYHLKKKFLYRYSEADYSFYLTRNSSLGITVIGEDVEQMLSSGMISLASIISESLVFFCLVGLVIFMNPSLALLIFGVGVVSGIFIIKILLPQFYGWGQKMQEASLYSHQSLLQFFHGFKEIFLLGKRDTFVNAFQYHSRKKTRIQAIQTAMNALPRIVIEVFFVVLFVTIILYLCVSHENTIQMISILGGYLYLGFRMMPGLNRVINLLNAFKTAIPSIERAYNEYTTAIAKENCVNVPNFKFEHSISLNEVSFHYPNVEKDTLTNISLHIKKGECIGIIGETGSGKSTLIDVILGLLRPYKGSILVDNQYPVNSPQWHQKIGYVPQSTYLTDDTIEANIAFGEEEIDELRLNTAIDMAQLRKFIDQLSLGAKTIVGERGIRLSGGERQRIAIARALYHAPEILIFDEATSALDNETEACFMETLNAVSQSRTVIMIAHRLTTLKNCDRIMMMKGGTLHPITHSIPLEKRKVVNSPSR